MSGWVRASVQALSAYVPGEQRSGPGVVKLNTNENPYPPAPGVLDALQSFGADGLRRYPDPGCTALRRRIADVHGCRPEQVFVGNGSDEVLALCTRAFVENEGRIGYFEPSYSLYPVLSDIRGVSHGPVELGPDFTWRMPAGYQCNLFFLTCPNAPTGMVYPSAVIHDFARDLDGVLVVDEAYVDFAGQTHVELALSRPNVLVARTLSKAHSLAGLRVGYALGSETLVDALAKIKDSYNLDALSQHLALAALGDMEHMRRNAARICATRERLAEALRRAGCSVCPSASNFLWVRPARPGAQELFERLKDREILIRYFPGPRTGEHVRVTVGTDAEVDTFLAAAKDIMGQEEHA